MLNGKAAFTTLRNNFDISFVNFIWIDWHKLRIFLPYPFTYQPMSSLIGMQTHNILKYELKIILQFKF